MYRQYVLLASLAGSLLALPAAAQQQQPFCSARTQLIGQLANQYSEVPVAMGLASNGGVIEVLTAKSGLTWTIVITMPNGTTCMVAAGESWEPVTFVNLGPNT